MRAADIGLRVVLLRNGVVLSKTAGILRKILPPFRLGLGGRVGSGTQWLPWIHLDDQIGLIRHAMSHEAVSGALNAVAPEPVTNAEFARALGEVLGRPTVLEAPLFALRLRFGRSWSTRCCSRASARCPCGRWRPGYAFRHPLLREALAEVLDKRPRNEAAPAPSTS